MPRVASDETAINNYISKLQSHRAAAEPWYMKKLKLRSIPWSLLQEVSFMPKRSFSKIIKFWLMSLQKRKIWLEHQAVETSYGIFSNKGSYLVYFLHYQPEMTTLPSSQWHAQQAKAIHELAAVIPDTITLVVKEHLATFASHMNWVVRPNGFYKYLASHKNVVLIPLSQYSSFELIDNSLAVATVSGTVGFEAICRGKKVLNFGLSPYKESENAILVESINKLRSAFDIIALPGDFKEKGRGLTQLNSYIKWCVDNTFWFTNSCATACPPDLDTNLSFYCRESMVLSLLKAVYPTGSLENLPAAISAWQSVADEDIGLVK